VLFELVGFITIFQAWQSMYLFTGDAGVMEKPETRCDEVMSRPKKTRGLDLLRGAV
jgi:hypothetical protein